MANKQQPPFLHLAELTSSQFLDIWKHFDSDGNGYIEGKELENFFTELEKARRGAGVGGPSSNVSEKMKEFMQKFDKNADGRIELSELAQILPTEENFLLCFRQFVSSSSEFMEAWRKYDTDRSGYIEANELKDFLSDLLKKANRHYDDQKLQEYTQTIGHGFLCQKQAERIILFSREMQKQDRLPQPLPVTPALGVSSRRSVPSGAVSRSIVLLSSVSDNVLEGYFFLCLQFIGKDGNGYIDEQELDALLKDLYEKNKKPVKSLDLLIDLGFLESQEDVPL
ncbi:Calretinin [Acipenser ruthenus]|uniref:Calretinin n=1 Tax=Acipenser ruthenus TaxID=7906 RepID=A0A444UEJ0_ACIRT|nr:Calretinin [Acipenser ruthenus]